MGETVALFSVLSADEIGVDVGQPDAPPAETSVGVKIEKDRSASNEGFDIAVELHRVVAPEDRQKLALPPCPFQEGPRRPEGAVAQDISRYRICAPLTIDP